MHHPHDTRYVKSPITPACLISGVKTNPRVLPNLHPRAIHRQNHRILPFAFFFGRSCVALAAFKSPSFANFGWKTPFHRYTYSSNVTTKGLSPQSEPHDNVFLLSEYLYYITFVDEWTRFCWIPPLLKPKRRLQSKRALCDEKPQWKSFTLVPESFALWLFSGGKSLWM